MNGLAASRRSIDVDADWTRRLFSPASAALYSTLLPRLSRHARGRVLDAGCGAMPFRRVLTQSVTEYDSLDVERRAAGVTFLGDVQDMRAVAAEAYDTVLCSEVLEHLPAPDRALAELHRVLRPGGCLILTVPFLARLHEEPHDYFRYTAHGLRTLLERHGFHVEEIVPTGSVFSFLGHQISTVAVVGTHGVPVLGRLVFALNALAVVLPCRLLDRLPGLRQKLPLGYVVVARRPESASA